MSFSKALNRLKEIGSRKFINDSIQKTLQKDKEIFEELITEDQLFDKGIGGDGVKLGSFAPYSPKTIGIKRAKGQKTSNVTLKDTGETYEKTVLKARKTFYSVNSTTPQVPDLKEKYGDEIFHFTAENRREIALNYIIPDLVKKMKGK